MPYSTDPSHIPPSLAVSTHPDRLKVGASFLGVLVVRIHALRIATMPEHQWGSGITSGSAVKASSGELNCDSGG